MNRERGLNNGYRVLYRPDHPAAQTCENWKGWVYEHVMIAEEMIGRRLRDDEVVHHLDGDRTNNRYSNLLVLENGQHSKLHKWIDQGCQFTPHEINTGNNNKYCERCNKTLQLKQKKWCSPECTSIMKRKVERPSKEELKVLIAENNWLKLGRMFGVSDNAVRKWARQYGLL